MIPLATGFGPTLEMTPLEVASTLHRGPGWWARSKTRPKTKKIRAPHRADSVYYPITYVLVLFCKWQFLGGHQCPSKGSGGDRWDRKWKILKKFDRCQPMSILNFITYNIEAVKISSRCLWRHCVSDNAPRKKQRTSHSIYWRGLIKPFVFADYVN